MFKRRTEEIRQLFNRIRNEEDKHKMEATYAEVCRKVNTNYTADLCGTARHSDNETEKENNQLSCFDDESLLADIVVDSRFHLEDTAVGSEKDLSESEETETFYGSREQPESDEDLPKEKTYSARQQTESPKEQKLPEENRPVNRARKKRGKKKANLSPKEVLQVWTKINTSINLWCTRKMSPASRMFQHWFLV